MSIFFNKMIPNRHCNIILNVDHVKDGVNDVQLYTNKIYGSYYHSDALKSRKNFGIHPNVLYVINCYDITSMLDSENFDKFIHSKKSNPIQEMLMILSNNKINDDNNVYMRTFYNTIIEAVRDKNIIDPDVRADYFYKLISLNYNVIILTSFVNLGIARSRGRVINYIIQNKELFKQFGLSHTLLLDDSDFIGFSNFNRMGYPLLTENCLYKQKSIKNAGNMLVCTTAAGYSYWQYLIPIDEIQYYCPLIADLAEDSVTEAYLEFNYDKIQCHLNGIDDTVIGSYLNNKSVSSFYQTEITPYEDHFVDYGSQKDDSSVKATTRKQVKNKMSKHYNPPALYIEDNKLCVYTISGNTISPNTAMKKMLFAKYVFILRVSHNDFYVIARGSTKNNKISPTIEKNLFPLLENLCTNQNKPHITGKYIISQTSNGLVSYKDVIYVEKFLVENRENEVLYVSEELLCDHNEENPLKVYKISNISDVTNYCETKQIYYYCYINGKINEEITLTYMIPARVQIQLPPEVQKLQPRHKMSIPIKQKAGGNDTINKNILKVIYMLIILIVVVIIIMIVNRLNKNEFFKKQINNVI